MVTLSSVSPSAGLFSSRKIHTEIMPPWSECKKRVVIIICFDCVRWQISLTCSSWHRFNCPLRLHHSDHSACKIIMSRRCSARTLRAARLVLYRSTPRPSRLQEYCIQYTILSMLDLGDANGRETGELSWADRAKPALRGGMSVRPQRWHLA